jgi:hypothetical protein
MSDIIDDLVAERGVHSSRVSALLARAVSEIERLREERLDEREAVMLVSREEGYKLLMDEIKTLHDERRWVPCAERLPEERRRVMAMVPSVYGPQVAWLVSGRWYDGIGGCGALDGRVTHWMPLPAPPEEK